MKKKKYIYIYICKNSTYRWRRYQNLDQDFTKQILLNKLNEIENKGETHMMCCVGCAKNPPTCQTRPNPTQPTGLGRFFRLGGLGWVTKKIFMAGWVGFGS